MLKLPYVPTADDLIDIAFRAGRRDAKVARSTGKRREVRMQQSDFARIEAAAKYIKNSLKTVVKQFPPFESLTPFQQALLDIKIDRNRYKKSLGAVDWCREHVERLEKNQRAAIRKGESTGKEFLGRAASFIKRIRKDLDFLVDVKRAFRTLPIMERVPTLVVAGFPNVGKSTFVKNLTGSDIEVKPYPFTTKGIMVGHVEIRHMRYQIIDSPGLLERPMDERNKIELEAVAALKHVAGRIFFMVDPTQDVAVQLRLLEEVSGLFKVDVVVGINKVDAVAPEAVDSIAVLLSKYRVFRLCANNPEECMPVFKGVFGL
ncbi:MAG: 50S ribosome-binding GTPase [Candidatus Altiarchaeota archaeon]|nr:50S ribosome-binding GTPase [Candidatus Altiarchaeota archaeon]